MIDPGPERSPDPPKPSDEDSPVEPGGARNPDLDGADRMSAPGASDEPATLDDSDDRTEVAGPDSPDA